MNNKKLNKELEKKEIVFIVLLFVGFIPMVIFLYLGFSPLTIYSKSSEYKKGLFIIKDFDCGTGYGASGFTCYGYGTINGKKAKVNLGESPYLGSGNKDYNYMDLSSDTIDVFYRPSLRQTILIRDSEDELDKNKYLKKGLINLVYPIFIYPLIFFYYKKVKRKLKHLKNEKHML